jgi:hypothetical protein
MGRQIIFFALLLWLLRAGAAPAADVQVNSLDNNAANLGNFTTESETNVAVFGALVVVGFNSTRQAGLLGSGNWNSFMGFAYSNNGGVSFTDGGFVPAGAAGNKLVSDPALAFDSAGTLYYASIGSDSGGISRIFVSQSSATSPVVTFANPVAIPGVLGGSAPAQDKELIAVDTTGGPFDGRVYVAWSEFPTIFSFNAQVLVAASSSQSPLAFATPIALSPSTGLNHGAMPAVAPNGDVFVVWASFASATAAAAEEVHIVRSTNGGGAFANPDRSDPAPSKTLASVTSTIRNMNAGGINIRTRGFPYIAIDHTPVGSATRGNIYVVFQATPVDGSLSRSEIFFTRSTDHGVNWSAPRDITSGLAATLGVDTTENDNWQPAITVSPDTGHLRVAFYSRREDPANIQIRVYEAGSTDGGLTWFERPLAATPFTPSTGYDPVAASDYMGDYLHAAPAGPAFVTAWGDTRNTCTPPAGATAPCSPPGRGDQDVFFASSADPSGPDLFITPWGAVTGIGPLWQSPDIFVVDAFGNPAPAAKGVVNQLRSRVRNIGSAAEIGATVLFRYAPIYIGLPDSALKMIAAPAVDLAAAGDAAGNDLKLVPVNWDLTDTTDTNGGVWPMPISAFDHFCVKVDVQSNDDINLANNHAQTNFVDVANAAGTSPISFRLLVGNPFDEPVQFQVEISELPLGYHASLRVPGIDELRDDRFHTKFFTLNPLRDDGSHTEFFTLNPHEIRVANLTLIRPPGFMRKRRTTDVVANVAMLADGKPVGGVSVRLAKANVPVEPPAPVPNPPVLVAQGPVPVTPPSEPPPVFVITLPVDKATVVRAAAEVLQQRNYPVAVADPGRGLVSSGSVLLSARELEQLVPPQFLAGMPEDGEGRYLVSFLVEEITASTSAAQSRVMVLVRIILGNQAVDSLIGGTVVPSNGVIEEQYLQLLAQQVSPLR